MSETEHHKTAYKCCYRLTQDLAEQSQFLKRKLLRTLKYAKEESVIDFSLIATCQDEFPRWDRYSCYSP